VEHFGVFAKFWMPGKVKTRLAATIGEVQSALVYREMLNYLVDSLQSVGDSHTIAYTPSDSENQFQELANSVSNPWQVAPQAEGSLGNRMAHFFESAFADPSTQNVVLIGSDCPTITPELCNEAFTQLQTNDVVLGPTFDGGYYLVGMSHRYHDIFSGITYSIESVLDQTLAKMKQDKLAFALLPQLQDIDEHPQLVDLKDSLVADPKPEQSKLLETIERSLAQEGSA